MKPTSNSGRAALGRTQHVVLLVLLGIVVLAGLVVSAWRVADSLAQKRIEALIQNEVQDIERSAESISRLAERQLSLLRGVPALLASDEGIRRHVGDRRNGRGSGERDEVANRRLAETVRDLGLDSAWIVDAQGVITAASSHAQESSLIGSRIPDRAYYQAAMRGERGEQYAVGRRTQVAGLFFSAPLLIDKRVVAAVVIKLDVPRLSHWVDGANAFITDGNGVIVLASESRIELRSLEHGRIDAMDTPSRDARYGRSEFTPLLLRPMRTEGHPRLVLVDAGSIPHVIAHAPVGDSDLTAHVMSRLDGIETIQTDARWAFVLLFGCTVAAAAMLVLAVLHLRKIRRHRQTLREVNDELHRLNVRLQLEATTDALTGCNNRRRFMEILHAEFVRSTRHGGKLSLLVADIDHFKRVNDAHGHAMGDRALQHFAAIAARLTRTEDSFARIGGEEFVFLLPEADEAGALVFAERVRTALESQPMPLPSGALHLTVSIGVATRRSEMGDGAQLLELADQALYLAKRTGRNKVTALPVPVVTPPPRVESDMEPAKRAKPARA